MSEIPVPSDASEPDLGLRAVRDRVDAVLDRFLTRQVRIAARYPRGVGELAEAVREFMDGGGKRLRPGLCVLGWCAADVGLQVPDEVLRAAAALELFHTFALIHDDVMDDSSHRRGRPTVHQRHAARYVARGQVAARHLGVGVAILAGDLALAWSDELLHEAGLAPERMAAVLQVVDAMQVEIVYGQYLDLVAAGTPTAVEEALWAARYKTAKYTFERPLHLGAALAGAPDQLYGALSAFALPAGEAFQLRDDLLGVFGDPKRTGKPVLDDLRTGKATVLLALARERATPEQAALLRDLVGQPGLEEAEAARVRAVLLQTGAVDTVEAMVEERNRQALTALGHAGIPEHVRAALAATAGAGAWRPA